MINFLVLTIGSAIVLTFFTILATPGPPQVWRIPEDLRRGFQDE